MDPCKSRKKREDILDIFFRPWIRATANLSPRLYLNHLTSRFVAKGVLASHARICSLHKNNQRKRLVKKGHKSSRRKKGSSDPLSSRFYFLGTKRTAYAVISQLEDPLYHFCWDLLRLSWAAASSLENHPISCCAVMGKACFCSGVLCTCSIFLSVSSISDAWRIWGFQDVRRSKAVLRPVVVV